MVSPLYQCFVVSRLKFPGQAFSSLALAITLTGMIFSSPKAKATNTLTANFDDLSDGLVSTNVVDGGITFSNLNIDSVGDIGQFGVVTNSDTNFGFSLPNYLNSGGASDGSFGNIYSLNGSFSGTATNISMNIGFWSDPNESNTLTLYALNGTNMVASTTYSGFASDIYSETSALLQLSWTSGFNGFLLKVNVNDTNISPSNPDYGNDFLQFGIDNVSVLGAVVVPEPSTTRFLFVALAGASLISFRLRSRKADQKSSPV